MSYSITERKRKKQEITVHLCYLMGKLAMRGITNVASLILSLKDNKDERVQMEVDRLRSKYQW